MVRASVDDDLTPEDLGIVNRSATLMEEIKELRRKKMLSRKVPKFSFNHSRWRLLSLLLSKRNIKISRKKISGNLRRKQEFLKKSRYALVRSREDIDLLQSVNFEGTVRFDRALPLDKFKELFEEVFCKKKFNSRITTEQYVEFFNIDATPVRRSSPPYRPAPRRHWPPPQYDTWHYYEREASL